MADRGKRPAFARPYSDKYATHQDGMTIREVFAKAAMQGLLANSVVYRTPEAIWEAAVFHADGVLAELDKPDA